MGRIDGAMLISGVVLILIELARSVPAWLRVRRVRNADGVSGISVGILAGTGPGWIAVAVTADSPAAATATVIWLIFHVMLWREVARAAPATARWIGWSASVSFVVTVAVAACGHAVGHLQDALGVAVAVASAAYSLPALISGMTSATTAGLSVVALAVNSVEGTIYLVAGLGLGGISPPGEFVLGYVFFGGVALASNVPRLLRTAFRRSTGRDTRASVDVVG